MVKSVKVWKLNFFKNDDENGGAMNEAIKQCAENEIVIHSQTKKDGRLWGNVEPKQFLKLIEKNYGLYEVITKFPHKVYFDIDKQGMADAGYLESIKTIILQFLPNAEMAISGSVKETKTSYHIILQNYVIHNEEERQHMKHLVKHITEHIDESFDWKVYTKNRNMKIINQSKDDGRVQEIIENPDYKAHCITCFIPDYSLPFTELPETIKEEVMVEKAKKTFDVGVLPKLVLTIPDDFDAVNATETEILGLLPINASLNHDYTHLVARFCYNNNISFETFIAWMQPKHIEKSKNPKHSGNTNYLSEEIKRWQWHWGKLDKFPSVSRARILSILKHFYPHITKDIHYRKFSQTFFLPTQNVCKIETISQSQFNNKDKKYKVFNVGMGGGKTAQAISYLSSEPNFLWIAPNKALATNTHKRFEMENVDVCHYETINTKKKKEGKMKEQDRLIICLNSIHYIADTNYNVLVIDEIETLIDKFLGDFLEQGKLQLKQKIWTTFLNLFRNAEQVILLDAFITTKTLKFIEQIEGHLNSTIIYERINEPQTRTIKHVDDEDLMLQDIILKLRDGNKLFIFYPYKNASNNKNPIKSMEQIYQLITLATNKKGIFYNADVDDKVKKGLKDVNTSWEGQDFIITNNIITCGVNYENLDFDYKYIFIASHNTPRDVIQVSYRARHLNSGIIKICYMGKMNQPNTWLNDCDKMSCKIYKALYNEILIEKKAPLKRALQLFCVKAHYKQKSDDFKVNEQIAKELTDLFQNHNLGMTYATIPNIDKAIAEIIEEKCFAQEATMLDKYALNKFYFQKSFIENDDNKQMLAEIWDEKFSFFFKRIGDILLDKDSLFHKIAELNKLKTIFPVDVKKTKLNDEIKTQIFKEFSFKYITASSSACKIVKDIYNTYFSKYIVSTQYYENSKDLTYHIDEDVYKYYEFAKENLILDSLTYMTYKQINNSEQVSDFEI